MKSIDISTNKFPNVFVHLDDDDFQIIGHLKWYAFEGTAGNLYAARMIKINGKRNVIFMHREIFGLPIGGDEDVDHRDGNGINNQRFNLRVCTRGQNLRNGRKRSCGLTSKYKGVSIHRQSGRFRAAIWCDYKKHHIGMFDREVDAAIAYNAKAVLIHGEFARLNQIEEAV